jgi:hypothetical protein
MHLGSRWGLRLNNIWPCQCTTYSSVSIAHWHGQILFNRSPHLDPRCISARSHFSSLSEFFDFQSRPSLWSIVILKYNRFCWSIELTKSIFCWWNFQFWFWFSCLDPGIMKIL